MKILIKDNSPLKYYTKRWIAIQIFLFIYENKILKLESRNFIKIYLFMNKIFSQKF